MVEGEGDQNVPARQMGAHSGPQSLLVHVPRMYMLFALTSLSFLFCVGRQRLLLVQK